MPFHNYIEVEREKEKRLYRICNELRIQGESYIEDAGSPEWQSTNRKFGIRGKPLIEEELLEPIWRGDYHSKYPNRRLIRVPKNVDVVERLKGKKSHFHFYKRKNK